MLRAWWQRDFSVLLADLRRQDRGNFAGGEVLSDGLTPAAAISFAGEAPEEVLNHELFKRGFIDVRQNYVDRPRDVVWEEIEEVAEVMSDAGVLVSQEVDWLNGSVTATVDPTAPEWAPGKILSILTGQNDEVVTGDVDPREQW